MTGVLWFFVGLWIGAPCGFLMAAMLQINPRDDRSRSTEFRRGSKS